MENGEIAPKEQFLLFSTIFCYLLVALCVKTGTRFSLRDKRLFEISEFEITRVDCICKQGLLDVTALDNLKARTCGTKEQNKGQKIVD